jgi:hypothetical protein
MTYLHLFAAWIGVLMLFFDAELLEFFGWNDIERKETHDRTGTRPPMA